MIKMHQWLLLELNELIKNLKQIIKLL